jgi:hypothetical protein
VNERVDHHQLVPSRLRPLSRLLGRRFRLLQHSLRNARATLHPRPIFVLGNQKSGTSAIAGLLARACGLSVSLDMLMETDRPLFQRVPSGELSFDRYVRLNRWEFSHAVVKEPNLTLLYPWLAKAFPDSPVVFVLRDPRDNIRSLLNGLEIPGDLPALEARHRGRVNAAWALVLDGRWIGIEGEHYIDQLARRWVRSARILQDHRDLMHLSRYEDFVAGKKAEIERLARALEQPLVADVSALVDRPFQPPGDRSAPWRDFFGSQNLERIESICGAEMRALDYRES